MPEEKDAVLGRLAVERGYLSREQLGVALEIQRQARDEMGLDMPLVQVLVNRHLLTPDQAQDLRHAVAVETGEAHLVAGYEVVSKLGQRGFGEVFKAKQAATGRYVALKILPPSLASEDMIARFERESEIVRRLDHQNIVSCVEFGYDPRRVVHFCALELIEGEDLGERIAREGVLSEAEALSITKQVAMALQHACFNGLVHRDVKPENIMVTPDGTAKLLDLGLARPANAEATRLTQTGMFVGSAYYASPEQAKSESGIDTRSDIYSLGATLYHMVTGKPPFQGSNFAHVLYQQAYEKLVWPAEVNPELSDGVCRVIAKMLAKDPQERYQIPNDLLRDIDTLEEGGEPDVADDALRNSSIALAVRPRRKRKRPASAPKHGRARETAARPDHGRRHARTGAPAAGGMSPTTKMWAMLGVGAAVFLMGLVAMLTRGGRPEVEPPPKESAAAALKGAEAYEAANPDDSAGAVASYEKVARDFPGTPEAGKAELSVIRLTAAVPSRVRPTTATSGARPPNVPPDAREFEGHWYKLFTEKMTWPDAKAFCERAGGHLVTITSKEENDFVTDLARAARDHCWIGLSDEAKEREWRWVTGEATTFTAWAPGEPNSSGGNEDWCSLVPEQEYRWNDDFIDRPCTVLCEWEPLPAAPPRPPAAGADAEARAMAVFEAAEVYEKARPDDRAGIEQQYQKVIDDFPHTMAAVRAEVRLGKLDRATTGADWLPIFNGRDMTGWRADGGRARIEDGALVSEDAADILHSAEWREFALDCEVMFTGPRVDISLAHRGMGRSRKQVLVALHDDGDAHVLAGGKMLWRSGMGKFPPGRWMRLRLHLTRDSLRVEKDGDVMGTADLAQMTVEKGGVCFWSWDRGSIARMRNIRVRVLDTEAGARRPPGVPPDAAEFGGHFYKLFTEHMSWHDAKAFCERAGGHLVTITSKEENQFILRQVEVRGAHGYWIGLTDEQEEGAFRWVTGEPVVFTNWRLSRPEQGPDGECAYMKRTAGYRWVDIPASATAYVTCEWEPAAPGRRLTLDLGGGVMMEIVYIEPGVFMMGGDEDPKDVWRGIEKPKHEVAITRGFYIGKHEVTRGQFAAFAGAGGYRTEAERQGWSTGQQPGGKWGRMDGASWHRPAYLKQTDEHPVVHVSWNDAEAFCRWAATKTRRNVRLPTEAEWEYACRAGSTSRFCFGDGQDDLAEYAWNDTGLVVQTHPVGRKRANAWDLHDMHGNVWEWVADWYDPDYYAKSPKKNPAGPDEGQRRVVRGGAWLGTADECRSACRGHGGPSYRYNYYGFRVAMTAAPDEAGARPDGGAQAPSGAALAAAEAFGEAHPADLQGTIDLYRKVKAEHPGSAAAREADDRLIRLEARLAEAGAARALAEVETWERAHFKDAQGAVTRYEAVVRAYPAARAGQEAGRRAALIKAGLPAPPVDPKPELLRRIPAAGKLPPPPQGKRLILFGPGGPDSRINWTRGHGSVRRPPRRTAFLDASDEIHFESPRMDMGQFYEPVITIEYVALRDASVTITTRATDAGNLWGTANLPAAPFGRARMALDQKFLTGGQGGDWRGRGTWSHRFKFHAQEPGTLAILQIVRTGGWNAPPPDPSPPNAVLKNHGDAPDDAAPFGGRSYRLFRRPLSWHDAKLFCEAWGGHLVTISSERENDFVMGLSRAHSVDAWIGLTDEREEGKWAWVTGEAVTFTGWATDEPNNSATAGPQGQDFACAQLKTGGWDDAGGSQLPALVCEWEAGWKPRRPTGEGSAPQERIAAAGRRARIQRLSQQEHQTR